MAAPSVVIQNLNRLNALLFEHIMTSGWCQAITLLGPKLTLSSLKPGIIGRLNGFKKVIKFAIIFILAYVVGSINFSILLLKFLGKDDPRRHFSGNPGVMNVYRQTGIIVSSVVLLLDVGKALGVSCLAVSSLPLDLVPWIGLGLIIGNRFTCFHAFRGGKGVASFLGFTLLLAPWEALLALPLWLIIYRLFRYAFIGSFFMVFILAWGALMACEYRPIPAAGIFVMVLFIIFNHRANILGIVHKKLKDEH